MLIKTGIKEKIKVFLARFAKPCIVFESYPVFSDNTKPVYDELVKRGYDKKYSFFWYIDNDTFAIEKKGKLFYWKRDDYKNPRNMLRNLSVDKGVKAIILCNQFAMFKSIGEFETAIYLTHGTPFKYCANYYSIPKEIDYCIASSQNAAKLISSNLNYDIKKIVILGQPRNDVFFEKRLNPHDYMKNKFKKLIIWYPTFRQTKYGVKTNSKHDIPIIYDNLSANKLNDFLKRRDVLIIIKPHFAQDLSYITSLNLSNIRFIDDKFYKENRITSYHFISSCDAMLTDYSSVFSDYLLCDKPIGLIWEDIEDYRKNPGLHPDFEKYTNGAAKIYNIEDLKVFIDDIANGVDNLRFDRNKTKQIWNEYQDGKNTKRVTDFIIEKASL